ncbi:hypothetical protein PLESTB_001286000 [Pleodorina starrii]|uniref:Uncharacterized protein n=1 Tax=Pleodorina starrii TaxID=330485 RepID=A0A9W6BUT4_9CHLO|nr:hypothetical protein PLESTB_001286000 [Pleodorina starrii]
MGSVRAWLSATTVSLKPFLSDLIGTCQGVSDFSSLVAKCKTAQDVNYGNRTACLDTPGCGWKWDTSLYKVSGTCSTAYNFALTLLLNQTDSWVSTFNSVRRECLRLTTDSDCRDFTATIVVNASRYGDFTAQKLGLNLTEDITNPNNGDLLGAGTGAGRDLLGNGTSNGTGTGGGSRANAATCNTPARAILLSLFLSFLLGLLSKLS